MLHCISSYFNPTNSKKIKENYLTFRKNLKVPLTTVELAFNDQPFFISDSIKIRGDRNNIMWQKERLLNIAIDSLPNNIDKIAWIDADILFENEKWFYDTEKELDDYGAVQLFEYVSEINGSTDLLYNNSIGFAKCHKDQLDIPWPKPGLCWAANRDILSDGLYDKDISGSNDTYQLIIWCGMWNHHWLYRMSPINRKEFLLGNYKQYEKVLGNIGYVKGNIKHLYHGQFKNRQYYHRLDILENHNFNPDLDISINAQGIFYWSSNKPILHEQIGQYFIDRKDDE